VHHLVMEQNQAFAWDENERGHFREDFFPPIVIPTVEHTPWVYSIRVWLVTTLSVEICGVFFGYASCVRIINSLGIFSVQGQT
jgi:hypothetical protein